MEKLRKKLVLALLLIGADMFLAVGMFCALNEFRQKENAGNWKKQREVRCVLSVKTEAGGEENGTGKATKLVALTFDDGPSARYTGKLLDGLKERGIRATFFLIGECIEGNEELVKRMDSEGHLVGVHCLYHEDLTKESPSEVKKELAETKSRIMAVTGKEPVYIRPPFGNWSEELGESVSMTPVFWSVDSLDWKLKNTDRIVSRVMKDTDDGDIILMHDEYATSVEAAFRIIDNLRAKGYTFVTVEELLID